MQVENAVSYFAITKLIKWAKPKFSQELLPKICERHMAFRPLLAR